MKKTLIYKLSLLIFLSVCVNKYPVAQEPGIAEIKAALIINFPYYIEYPNEDSINVFKIGIFGNDPVILNELMRITKSKERNGKPVLIVKFDELPEITKTQLLYVIKKRNSDIEEIKGKIGKNNTLLITDSYDYNKSMINIVYKDNKIRYEINEDNIAIKDIKVAPRLIALAKTGTELKQLYIETGELLDTEKKKAEELREELQKLEHEITNQNKEIKKQKEEINQQNKTIQNQLKNINNQEEKHDSLIKNNKLYQKTIDAKIQVLKTKENEIQEQEKEINKKKTEVLNQKGILKMQQNDIKTQQNIIESQKTVLNKQFRKIETQQIALYSFIVLSFLTFGLVFFIYRAYKIKKESNIILAEKNIKINHQKEEIQTQRNILKENNIKLEKLSIVASETDNAITIFNKNGNMEWINNGFIKLFGFTLQEIIDNKGVNIRDVSNNPFIDKVINDCITQKKSIAYDCHNKTKYEKKIWTRTTLTPIFNDAGNLTKIVAIDSDITKLKETEDELKIAKDAADTANRFKSEFLANMSHEIRTPMNSIIGFSDLLSRTITDKLQKSYISSVISSGKNLLLLINDILDLSKIEAGKLEIQKEFINPYSFFNEINSIFDLKIKEKGLDFLIDIKKGLPQSLYLADVRVRQILVNLIGNAVKFTNIGYIKLLVDFKKIRKKKAIDLIVSVEDTGIGIPKKALQKIFEPFIQEEAQSTRRYEGTGLGLSITKRLVGMMNGTITVKSTPGKGSIFQFILHNIEVSDTITDISKITNLTFDYFNIEFEEATILVADDIETIHDLIKAFFNDTKIKLIIARDGKQAVELAQKHKPDAIIMDIKMPVMDGIEATNIIKENPELKHIPVVAISASVIKTEKRKIMQEGGFVDFIEKPFQISELYQKLTPYLAYSTKKAIKEENVSPQHEWYDKISIEDKEKLPEIIARLEGEFMQQWETYREEQPMEEIKEFGNQIKTLGKQYKVQLLNEFGENLLTYTKNFDIDNMLITLKSFPGMIKKLKSIID